jgi:hypothetical protein
MFRSSVVGIGLAVAALAAFQVTGCSDNGGGGTAGTTGSAGSTGSAGTTGVAGTTGIAGTMGSGGTGTAGTNATAGSTGSAGTSATAGSTGSAGRGGSGGSAGSGGSTGAAGTSGTAGAGGAAFGQPACLGTVVKAAACAATDQQLCYKTCGPQAKGVKSETCTGGIYVEMDGCSFDPAGDYTCYKLPTTANAMCPTTAPQAGTACTVDMCNPCNSTGGLAGGGYLDTSGNAKTGYCVCPPAGTSGSRNWSCASNTAWPPQ